MPTRIIDDKIDLFLDQEMDSKQLFQKIFKRKSIKSLGSLIFQLSGIQASRPEISHFFAGRRKSLHRLFTYWCPDSGGAAVHLEMTFILSPN